MIRRGNICSTKRASHANAEQGQNSKVAESRIQTFSVNRLADGPCRQSSFLVNEQSGMTTEKCSTDGKKNQDLPSKRFYSELTGENGHGSAGKQLVKGYFGAGGAKSASQRRGVSSTLFALVAF